MIKRCDKTLHSASLYWWLGCALWLAIAAFSMVHAGSVSAMDAVWLALAVLSGSLGWQAQQSRN